MKGQCAWCNKDLHDGSPDTAEERNITHVICDECKSNIEFQRGADLSRFLDSLNAPILLLDPYNRVQFLNREASELSEND